MIPIHVEPNPRELSPLVVALFEKELGSGWTDDLDFVVSVPRPFVAIVRDLLRRDIGNNYLVCSGDVCWLLFTHA